jgi:hypothetical protein
MIPSINPPSLLARTLLGRRMLVAITLVLTYGGGFWLWLLHEVEGATELNEPPGVIHWLRDSTLSLPLVAVGVVLGAMLARRLLARCGRNASGSLAAALIAVVLAFYASAVLSVGNPIHGVLFAADVHGGGHELPVAVHVVRDGLLALSANEVLAFLAVTVVLGYQLVSASRRLASIEAA